jgi:hypothetical protein
MTYDPAFDSIVERCARLRRRILWLRFHPDYEFAVVVFNEQPLEVPQAKTTLSPK